MKAGEISYNLFLPCAVISREGHIREVSGMETKLQMIYWKGDKFWVGKLLEHPEIMTQGKTLEELEENMRDAYMLMTLEDVPENHKETG
jgi:predicted RNase H-like HicB family nuclease